MSRLFVFFVFVAVFVAQPVTADDKLQVGVAEVEITPPVGFPMAGYYHERLATATTDPLKAKAVVLRGNNQAAAFVVADLTGISHDLFLEVRKAASKKTGIPPEHIVLSATHSHTAPAYYRNLFDLLGERTKANQTVPYSANLINNLVKAIVDADAAASPAVLEAGSALQTFPVSFNRRFVMRDGSVKTWQSLSNPNVIRAAGPIDPEIGLVLIKSSDGKTARALISNFALHLDTVAASKKLTWSADFPYFIEQAMRKKLGNQLISVFGTGTCGDINHSDPTRKTRNTTKIIGTSLAKTIDAAIPQLEAVKSQKFQVKSATVRLPLQEIRKHEIEKACHLLNLVEKGEKINFFEHVAACKSLMLDQYRNRPSQVVTSDYLNWGLSKSFAGIGDSLPVEVTTMTIGSDVAIVFLPGEVFVNLGLAIKQASPFKTTLIIELSNCVETVYIPTRAAYAGGSYEVTNSTVQPGSGEMLIETALNLLREAATTK